MSINVASSLQPTTANTPLDARSVVATMSDIAAIPLPYVGLRVYVTSTGKEYRVTGLKAKTIGALTVQNAAVDTYEEIASGSAAAADNDYTAFEVYATNAQIAAGTADDETGIEYAENVPAGMTHTFNIRSDHPRDVNDVVVAWGDGSTTRISELDEEHVDAATDADTEEITYTLSHTYTTPGRYIVTIRGRNYWGLSRPSDAAGIISRIFDDDLPLASCVQNLAGLCRNSMKLQGVNVPTGMQMFTNIVNASAIFEGCRNLIYLNNFETKFAVTRTMTCVCRNCANLRYSDLKLPLINPYRQAANIPSVSSAYNGCAKLGLPWTNLKGVEVTTTIQSLFPYGGFAAKAVNISDCFRGCAELTGTIPAAYLWQDTNCAFTASNCFTGCTKIAGQAPVSWGGTNAQLDTLIANHFWNYMPTARMNTIGGIKPDGITTTVDDDGTLHATGSGSGTGGGSSSGEGLPGQGNTVLDTVSVVSGNRNLCGGYAVRILDYAASENPGGTYAVIGSLAGEDDDAPDIDWSLLTIGTTVRVCLSDGRRIQTAIASADSTACKIYFSSKLQSVTEEYTAASGTYAANTAYATGSIEEDTGRMVYTDLEEGTDYTAGDDIDDGDNVFRKTTVTAALDRSDLVCGAYAVVSHPGKGSDRASYCFGTDNASNGNLSYVYGNANSNGGTCSVVEGFGNACAASFASVHGLFNQVSGDGCSVHGVGNKVDAKHTDSFVAGAGNELIAGAGENPQFNTVIGTGNKPHGHDGVLVGGANKTCGTRNICVGMGNEADGTDSAAIGSNITNKTDKCVALGHGYEVDDPGYEGALVHGNGGMSFAARTRKQVANPLYGQTGQPETVSKTAYALEYRGRLKPLAMTVSAAGALSLDHDQYARWDITASGSVSLSLANWEDGDAGIVVFNAENTTLNIPAAWIVPEDFSPSGVTALEIIQERGTVFAHVLAPFQQGGSGSGSGGSGTTSGVRLLCLCTSAPASLVDGMIWIKGGTNTPSYITGVGGIPVLTSAPSSIASQANGTIIITEE